MDTRAYLIHIESQGLVSFAGHGDMYVESEGCWHFYGHNTEMVVNGHELLAFSWKTDSPNAA